MKRLKRIAASPAHSPRLHRTIWYMGVKARVLPGFLDRVLEEEAPEGSTVVDLMSGSGVVAAHCANRCRVFANDVQHYAHVIARSLIEHDPRSKPGFLGRVDPRADLSSAYGRNYSALEKLYEPALETEARLLERFAGGDAGRVWCSSYRRFLETQDAVWDGPRKAGRSRESMVPRLFAGAQALLNGASIGAYRADPSRRPACLVTAYHANIYFGLRQAMAIDSLRAAIEDLPARSAHASERRTHYLSALLHAASVSTSGTSHFAQPRHLTKDSELRAMAERRSIDIFERLEAASVEILETVRETRHRQGNQAFVGDYRRFVAETDRGLEFRFPGKVDLVYLDPPYTADHYSRFYHVLEVIARYDYPELERDASGRVVRGRYPRIVERFQSDFCRRGRVENEFRAVIRAAAGAKARLIVSYASPTGLLLKEYARRSPDADPVAGLRRLCKEGYRSVNVERMPLLHSGQGDRNLRIEELLVVCRDPR